MECEPRVSRSGAQLEEDDIHWLHDPSGYRYVREKAVKCKQRVTFPKKNIGDGKHILVLGYATLRHEAKSHNSGCFLRRIWYIKPGLDPWPSGAPIEAVKIESIRVGKESEKL